MHLRHTRRSEHAARLLERLLVLGRKADDHVGRQVEVRERLESPEVGRGRVAPTHCAQHPVVARLQRNVQVPGDGRCLPQRPHELFAHVVDLDRRQAQTLEARRRADLAHEPRQRVAALTIAEAAEVDAREHDLAMALLDPLDDLPQDRAGAAASRRPAHERDHAEFAREAAPVLDADKGADTVEPRIGLNASDRADVARDERRSVLGSPRDDGHVLGQTCERARRGWPHTRSRTRADGCAPPERRPDATCARPRSSRSRC